MASGGGRTFLQDVTSSVSSHQNQQKDQSCSCSKLSLADVPCATLPKSPEKCKKRELQGWLTARAISYKVSSTRMVLANRVKKLMENDNYQIVDPDPNQSHLRAKQNACKTCNPGRTESSSTDTSSIPSDSTDKDLQSYLLKKLPKEGWSSSTSVLPQNFTALNLLTYIQLSGKKIRNGHKNGYVQQTLDKGYKLFYEGYVHLASASSNNQVVFVKSKCFPTLKKNDPPHNLCVALNMSGDVHAAHCSCKAGTSGMCNHVVGLLYQIDHCVRMKLDQFPNQGTCTDRPQQWHRSRTEGVTAEPIMTSVVYKPSYANNNRSSAIGVHPLLYDARKTFSRETDISKLETLQEHLKEINPYIGILQVVNPKDMPVLTDTFLQLKVPKGSVLSYQLAVTEGNFNIVSDFSRINEKCKLSSLDEFPDFPLRDSVIYHLKGPDNITKLVSVTKEEAKLLEEKTRSQSDNKDWINQRKIRLTSSNFGAALNRKSAHETFVKENITEPKDLSKIPAIKWGKTNEATAVNAYVKYMKNVGRSISVKKCGLVVNSACSFLAASPDRRVADAEFGHGLLEIKCPYSFRDISPDDAAENSSFYVSIANSKPRLKTDHSYYFQVQGQMGITGARWCDFIVWTTKGLSVERIPFDSRFWEMTVLKLKHYYEKYVIPALNVA